MHNLEIPPKLRWACRRGMLELDVLLGNFLQEKFLLLSAQDQAFFVKFLENNDQDLFIWLTGKAQPEDKETKKMVDSIREHAKHRH